MEKKLKDKKKRTEKMMDNSYQTKKNKIKRLLINLNVVKLFAIFVKYCG